MNKQTNIAMNKNAKIILVEDDPELGPLMINLLHREHFDARLASDGQALDPIFQEEKPDLIILDLMLPGEDGLSICRRIRAHSNVPILMLTAKKEEIDRIIGLEIGADDYLGKPFNPRELIARIRAILRRTSVTDTNESNALSFGKWMLKPDQRRLTHDGEEVTLTSGEYELLLVLLTHAGRVLTRDWLMETVKGRSLEVFDRTIDVQVSRLRHKIEADKSVPQLIKTVRNGGYLFAAPVTIT